MEIRRLSDVLKTKYGEKVYKLSLSSGCTCPNRDGTKGYGGCIFCSEGGSGEFSAGNDPLNIQIEKAKKLIAGKTDASKFIAYFQAFSNTYGNPARLEGIFREVIERDEIVILSIGTRPDCLPPEILDILKNLNKIKPVWVELGLQTAHERTALEINRGYSLQVFEDAYKNLKNIGIGVIIHLILGLPEETQKDMISSAGYVSELAPSIDGIKLHMLQILKGTGLARRYENSPFHVMTLEEYGDTVVKCLKVLPRDTVIHRITGDGPRRLLIEPLWSLDKKHVLNTLNRMIREA